MTGWKWLHVLWPVPAIALLIAARSNGRQGAIDVPLAHENRAAEHVIFCDEKRPQRVRVTQGRITVLSFPFNPKEVVPGNLNFDFKKIKSDLVIKAMSPQGATNLLVYLEDRRCSFDLVTVAHAGDDILVVEDRRDEQMEVPFHE